MSLSSLLCSDLCGSVSVCFVVHRLIVQPLTKLILILYVDLHILGSGCFLGEVIGTQSTSTPRPSQTTLEDLAAVWVVGFSGSWGSSGLGGAGRPPECCWSLRGSLIRMQEDALQLETLGGIWIYLVI